MTAGRVLSLRELDRPFFCATVEAMKKLREEFPGFDLGPGVRRGRTLFSP